MDVEATRQEIIRLLERAAAALIDAEDHGPTWPDHAEARHRAAEFKAQADQLEQEVATYLATRARQT